MYELKNKIGKVFTSKSVRTGPSSYEKRIYRAAVSQRLRNTALVLYSNEEQGEKMYKDKQCTYNGTLRHEYATVFAVGKQ